MAGARLRGSRIEEAQAAAQNISALFEKAEKKEKLRRDRQSLDNIATAISSGATSIQEIQAAANQPATFDPGIGGFMQRFAGGSIQPGGGPGEAIQSSIVSDALKRALQPQIAPPTAPEGLEISGQTVSPTGAKSTTFARPQAGQRQAGPLQVAKDGDLTGLAAGTVFQAGPQGKINIISEAGEEETLTFEERRKRDLIAAGILPKEISDIEKEKLQLEVDKNRKEFEGLGIEGKLTGDDKVRVSTGLRKEFDALSSDFRKIRDSFSRINAAVSDPSAAGDLAIIFNFMKILDPGSVVRESEFATAENAAGVPDKVRNLWNKALTGERITFNRGDFVSTAKRLFESQETIQGRLVDRYSTLATRFGVDSQDVVTETGEFTEQIKPSQPSQPETPQFTSEEIEAELKRRGVQ